MKKNKWALFLSFFVSALLITIMGGCKGSGEMTEDYDTLPKLREYTPPQFPETATVTKEKAEVRLNLRIDEEGNVRRATVLRSSGDDQLDSAAIAAARTWKYYPASKAGKPLPIVIEQKVSFATKVTESISFYEIVVDRKDLADSLWKVLDAGGDFSEIAVKFSMAPTAPDKGLRENVRYDALPDVLRSTLDKLGAGAMSKPIELPDGKYAIVKKG
ncbi:MAG: TonB family protein [Bacteroidota bacterium]